jgi:hypothetical protein
MRSKTLAWLAAVVACHGPTHGHGTPTDSSPLDGTPLDGPDPGFGTVCVTSTHDLGTYTVTGPMSRSGVGTQCVSSQPTGTYSVSAPGATATPANAVLVDGGTVTFTLTYSSNLQYFGYWRDALTGSTAEIQDQANISMVDTQLILAINPLNAVMICDDCDVGVSASQWASRKQGIETQEAMFPGTAHFMIDLGDGNADGMLDFRGIPGFALPAGVDWVGLECYPAFGWASCQANLDALKPLLPANGRAWVFIPTETDYAAESVLVSNAQDMYDGASQDPTVVGMIGFVWTNTILCPPDDCTKVFATKELPTLLAKMRCISHSITGLGAPSGC